MSSSSPARSPANDAAFVAGATLLAVFLSLLAITPKLVPWHDQPLVYETTKVAPMTDQLADPAGWDRAYLTNPEFNGIQSIRWRLLLPVLGHTLGLSPHVYFTLPWIGAAWLVGLAIHYSRQRGATRWNALAVGVLTGTSSAFFSASCAMGYFDPFYLIPLVIVCYTPSPVILLAACVLGPWVDEKFLFMLPVCGLVRWSWKPDPKWVWLALAGIAPYCLARISALFLGDSSFSRQIEIQSAMFANYAPTLPKAWWYGFRAGWLLILPGLWLAARTLKPREAALFFTALLAAVGAVSFLAWDTTRSIAMLMPLLLLGLQWPLAARWLPLFAALNLLLPAAYVWCGIPVTVPLTSILQR
jgi:hypothetical protein